MYLWDLKLEFLFFFSMIRIQKKISRGLSLLQFFTTRNWVFKNQNFLNLVHDLNESDKQTFSMDYLRYPVEKYMVYCALGVRQYCLKENLKSLPRCRIQQKMWVHFKIFGTYTLKYISFQIICRRYTIQITADIRNILFSVVVFWYCQVHNQLF